MLPRNDIRQYDALASQWREPHGAFAALHWLAEARAALLPPAARRDALLVDVGCGGGLFIPYRDGYRYLGIDLTHSALEIVRAQGLPAVLADAGALPLPDECADVVVAGELFEHVHDLDQVVAEIARILRPGGAVVFDTISDTRWARFALVTLGERLRGGPPRGIHDPRLFVAPARVRELFARRGVAVWVRGLRPSLVDYVAFVLGRRVRVRMLRTRSLAGVYQGVGRKQL